MDISNANSKASSSKEEISLVDRIAKLQDVVDRRVSSLYFDDGKRIIDFVLAYQINNDVRKVQKNKIKRDTFEMNLLEEGLELEYEDVQKSQDGLTYFVKIHAPWNVLTAMAEIMQMKMPIEVCKGKNRTLLNNCYDLFFKKWNPFSTDIKEELRYFTAPFSRQHLQSFLITDRDTFFSSIQRSRIVWDMLCRIGYDSTNASRIGVSRLIANGAYHAAYPLHEGSYCIDHANADYNKRQMLYDIWARFSKWCKKQPLDLIRNYFGEQIAIYFSWLGYYTTMLFYAAVVGIFCLIFGTLDSNPSSVICDQDKLGSTVMCPQCNEHCDYWRLSTSCLYSKISYVFDNTATVFFAVFMSIWATLFLEFWKRRQASLAWNWDAQEYDLEKDSVRPEFLTSIKTKKMDPVTKTEEPYVVFHVKLTRWILSGISVIFFLCLVIGFLFGIIVYRVIVFYLLSKQNVPSISKYAKITTSTTAALINLVVIIILGRLYEKLAWYLTELEYPRTNRDFEDSYALKVFLFQFINYYSSLFYIAFFKGRFAGIPGSSGFFGYRQEECDPAGCMVELLIQLSIIMVGKQMLSNFMELVFPLILNFYRQMRSKMATADNWFTRWEQDFNLNPVPPMVLFREYLEMVIQFGFVTLFVAAFPLAPLFAFLNNIIEIRLDAYKFVTAFRRPKPQRAASIGVWYNILDGITKVAVLTNAAVIAFTSDFVPRLLFFFIYSKENSLFHFKYYISATLSVFNVSDFSENARPSTIVNGTFSDVELCSYRGYRYPPCLSNSTIYSAQDLTAPDPSRCEQTKYELNIIWWHVLAARLLFILVFEHVVFFVKGVVAYLVPDIPRGVLLQMQRENYLARRARLEAELARRREGKSVLRSRMISGVANQRSSAGGSPSDQMLLSEGLLATHHAIAQPETLALLPEQHFSEHL